MSDFDVDIRWAQINNAIVPVVHRRCDDILTEVPLVPLLVIRHAVGLLKDVHVDTVSCTHDEARALTKCCQDVGIKICFDVTTELINLDCLPDLSEEKTVTDYIKEVDERILKKTDQVYINNITEDQQQQNTTERNIAKYEVKKTADYLTMTNHQNGGILIMSKISRRTSMCSTEVVVRTRSIFGEQVHCLMKDGELYVLIEELHRLFFYNIDLSIFVHVYKHLVTSTIDITSHEVNLMNPFIGRIRCSEIVRFDEVKCLLVNLKDIVVRVLPCTKSEYGLRYNATQTCQIEDGQSTLHEEDGMMTSCGVTESKNTEYNCDLTNDRCVTDTKQDTDYHNVFSHLALVD
ncbi:hypothetical protein LSH36_89g08035 [Paralvinella palmiformis]|uniref:Uncharacterized protein n=1 Tax=Paralvinella palmiformis TaxID=53620 RepID=A0AAD9K1D0_9ANNE|nr:hypothetical protein LSH36_89g08035 [Paralvinella palmiformis]